ncbi:oxysterol-binding protein 2-like [Fukomys damarensis]|uniref:oxysterol-binding protein 2-like n=1 Tax=Fukomys damarensis TaxID=885580 RepID=UPI0008FF6635|nr:oxysterol-binding protein 2-like [Fukomys damarensis]
MKETAPCTKALWHEPEGSWPRRPRHWCRKEPKPQPQLGPASERESSERVRRSEPGSETSPEPRPGPGQETELLGLRPRSEPGPGAGPGSLSRVLAEHLAPLGSSVESEPLLKPEFGSVPKPLPLLRPGQAKTPLGVPVSGNSSTSSDPMASLPLDSYKGWLLKWTNYLKGYQRRWFVLGNGLLSYYRNQGEMAHTCRGTINLATVQIGMEDSCGILLISGARNYHLKGSSEVDRQQWITALELAKAKAVRMMNTHSGNLYSPGHQYADGIH